MLLDLLARHQLHDASWPPPYTKGLDLAAWLGQPADLYRWVALMDKQIIGHMGLGTPSPACLNLFHAAINDPSIQFAELCRTVTDPSFRKVGAAAKLTRHAIKTALIERRIPVATVLTNRDQWLTMMCDTGWQPIGELPAIDGDDKLVCLLPPQK